MKVNRFYLGLWIINIILFNFFLNAINEHPEILNKLGSTKVWIIFAFGLIGIVANCFNAFEKEKK